MFQELFFQTAIYAKQLWVDVSVFCLPCELSKLSEKDRSYASAKI